MTERFDQLSFRELVDLYADAHALPRRFTESIRNYCMHAAEREAWTVTYMDFSVNRYSGRALRGARALDAGTGSGGALAHLAERFDHVAGLDPDLPALLVAARRCHELGIADRVFLVAAMLEQPVWPPEMFDAIKCTDVIEHVDEPAECARVIASALRAGGCAFVLTPNKWSFFNPEPHVRLWGVQFLPPPIADAWVGRRFGMRYRDIARLFSSRRFVRTLRAGSDVHVRPIPVEDKHLNPFSPRGQMLKARFERPPLSWASRTARPLQPTLEALVVRR